MDSWSIQTLVRTVVVDHSFLESEWDAVSGQTGCAIWNAKGETDQCEALVQREAVARDAIAGVTVRVKGARLQLVRLPSRNSFVLHCKNRSGSGGNGE